MITIPHHLVGAPLAVPLAEACHASGVTLTTRVGAYLVGSGGDVCREHSAATPHGGVRVGEGYALVGDTDALRDLRERLRRLPSQMAGRGADHRAILEAGALHGRVAQEMEYLYGIAREVWP